MPSISPPVQKLEPLSSIWQAYASPSAAWAEQVVRVWKRIMHSDRDEEVRQDPRRFVIAYRSKGLIPPRLQALCLSHFNLLSQQPADDAKALACIFAACAYPNRAFQLRPPYDSARPENQIEAPMAETELDLRFRAFEESFHVIERADTIIEALHPITQSRLAFANQGATDLPKEEFLQWLADLSACRDPLAALQASAEDTPRCHGAALYLATCYPALLKRIHQTWRSEADLLRYLTGALAVPPSVFTQCESPEGKQPEWESVRAALKKKLPAFSPACHEAALILEQMVWKEAQKWLPPTLWARGVGEFWEFTWEKLTSGFPYYAFRARFAYWWKQCLAVYPFSHLLRETPLDEHEIVTEAGENIEEESDEDLSLEQLRVVREGYRLVRTSFFPLPAKNLQPADHLVRNERVRCAVDELWYRRLLAQNEEKAVLKEIVDQFPELGEDAINNYSHRLKRRFEIYTLARWQCVGNARLPARNGKTEPGELKIAALAKTAPPEQTLLWAFVTQVFLQGQLESQRPDPWDLKRLVHELWYWVREETFAASVRSGVRRKSHANQLAARLLSSPPFQQIVAELRQITTPEALRSYVAQTDFSEAQAAIQQALNGADKLENYSPETLRKGRKQKASHWFIPVWYLTQVERFDKHTVLKRLAVEPNDYDAVDALCTALSSERSGEAL